MTGNDTASAASHSPSPPNLLLIERDHQLLQTHLHHSVLEPFPVLVCLGGCKIKSGTDGDLHTVICYHSSIKMASITCRERRTEVYKLMVAGPRSD